MVSPLGWGGGGGDFTLKKKEINKNTGVSCHFLLQGIFPTQGSS